MHTIILKLCECQLSDAVSLAENANNIAVWNKGIMTRAAIKNGKIVDLYYYGFIK